MGKFDEITEKGTNGSNYNVSTDDIVEKLSDWDSKFGISVSNVEHNQVDVHFQSVPKDLEEFAREVYSFCPDIVDQGYGCLDEMVEMMEESGQPIPEQIEKQIEWIDFSDEDFGLRILQRVVEDEKHLSFWWD